VPELDLTWHGYDTGTRRDEWEVVRKYKQVNYRHKHQLWLRVLLLSKFPPHLPPISASPPLLPQIGCNMGSGHPQGLTGWVRHKSGRGNDSATRMLSNKPKNVQNGQELTEISSKQSKETF
jgi:hypothetical protein